MTPAAPAPDPVQAGVVPTYRGPVGGADLGWTVTHEHLFVLAPELDGDYPHPEWDADAAVDTAVRGLDELYRLGVRAGVLKVVTPDPRDIERMMVDNPRRLLAGGVGT